MGMIHYIRRGSKLRIMAGDCPKWITNSSRAAYIRAVCLSAPLWVRMRDFAWLHIRAKWETVMHGKLHVLDHIIPVTHPRVCGLTVPWNMRIIPWDANCSKGNAWNPDQQELFPSTIIEDPHHALAFHHRTDRLLPQGPQQGEGASVCDELAR